MGDQRRGDGGFYRDLVFMRDVTSLEAELDARRRKTSKRAGSDYVASTSPIEGRKSHRRVTDLQKREDQSRVINQAVGLVVVKEIEKQQGCYSKKVEEKRLAGPINLSHQNYKATGDDWVEGVSGNDSKTLCEGKEPSLRTDVARGERACGGVPRRGMGLRKGNTRMGAAGKRTHRGVALMTPLGK